jgi:hypothetical protein
MRPFGVCVGGIGIRYQSVLIFCSMGWFGECTIPLGTAVVLQSKLKIDDFGSGSYVRWFFSLVLIKKETSFHVIKMIGLPTLSKICRAGARFGE